jgi:hypothetical protein
MVFESQDNRNLPLRQSLGERVGVRGYLLPYFDCAPLTFVLSPQGERRFFDELSGQAF